MATNLITDNDFYCTQCGRLGLPIIRRKGSEREAGHLKKLFCLYCNKETNHVECRPWSGYTHDDFVIEFEHGNFTEEGVRKMPYNQLKGLIHDGKI